MYRWLAMTGLLCSVSFYPSFAAEHEVQRTITVTGKGSVTAAPDMAVINTGVVTSSETAKDALQANNQAMNKIMELLSERNIADRDRQTSGFNIYPEYEQNPRGRNTNKVIGYRVTNQLSLRIRDLDRLGEILDALVSKGSNQISGINFTIDKMDALRDSAREDAVKQAQRKAELYALAGEVRVGKVLTINEQSVSQPRPMAARMMYADSAERSVPIARGEQEVEATVQVVFELLDR